MTERLSRPAASDAVQHLGWRYLLGVFKTHVPVPSQTLALDVAQLAVAACGADADGHLAIDLRPTRVELTLVDREIGHVTARDAELALDVTAALADRGFATQPLPDGGPRGVQMLEIAFDTMDAARIRPFWKAVLGYVDEIGSDGLVDPMQQGATIWFQQMDEPRSQRNRIHFDITVPHDEADERIAAAVSAGGRVVSTDAGRAFTILADAEGNEICVCTWQDRD